MTFLVSTYILIWLWLASSTAWICNINGDIEFFRFLPASFDISPIHLCFVPAYTMDRWVRPDYWHYKRPDSKSMLDWLGTLRRPIN